MDSISITLKEYWKTEVGYMKTLCHFTNELEHQQMLVSSGESHDQFSLYRKIEFFLILGFWQLASLHHPLLYVRRLILTCSFLFWEEKYTKSFICSSDSFLPSSSILWLNSANYFRVYYAQNKKQTTMWCYLSC